MIAHLSLDPGPDGADRCRPEACAAAGNERNGADGCAQVRLDAGEMRI